MIYIAITEKQKQYNKEYNERNREKKRYISCKATAKNFILKKSNLEDLQALKLILLEREQELITNNKE